MIDYDTISHILKTFRLSVDDGKEVIIFPQNIGKANLFWEEFEFFKNYFIEMSDQVEKDNGYRNAEEALDLVRSYKTNMWKGSGMTAIPESTINMLVPAVKYMERIKNDYDAKESI